MWWIKSGIENPSKSEVIGRCGGDEKTNDKRRTLKNVNSCKILFIVCIYESGICTLTLYPTRVARANRTNQKKLKEYETLTSRLTLTLKQQTNFPRESTDISEVIKELGQLTQRIPTAIEKYDEMNVYLKTILKESGDDRK